jgi:hypothetical protein
LKIEPSSFSNKSKLAFNWTLIEFTASQMNLQLNFENPSYVSSNVDQERLRIIFHGFYMFTDQKGNYMQPKFETNLKLVPRQIETE